jgi:hypothetical protein
MALEPFISGQCPYSTGFRSRVVTSGDVRNMTDEELESRPDRIDGMGRRTMRRPFDGPLIVHCANILYQHAMRVHEGDIVTYKASGRTFRVLSANNRSILLAELGTFREVRVRTMHGFTCLTALTRARNSIIGYGKGRPELWEMVYDHPQNERHFRWLVFCDYLQDGHWGEEWAERAEAIREYVGQRINRSA